MSRHAQTQACVKGVWGPVRRSECSRSATAGRKQEAVLRTPPTSSTQHEGISGWRWKEGESPGQVHTVAETAQE